MASLDDLFYFDAVVQHGGFSAAGRALAIPKSKLSRRVANLESRLDVRLIERSTRRFQLTAIGESFYSHCRAALDEAAAAEEAALTLSAEPRGLVRLGCPPGFGEHALAAVLPAFFAAYPKVRVEIITSLLPVDLFAERVDMVVRADPSPDLGQDLVIRKLGLIEIVLVASPAFLAAHSPVTHPDDLTGLPTISYQMRVGQEFWELFDAADAAISVRHAPRIIANDFAVMREAALEGLGVARLPQAVCYDALASGRLLRVLPDYHSGETDMHLIFTSRRGMLPSVRVLVDHLIATLPDLMRERRDNGRRRVQAAATQPGGESTSDWARSVNDARLS